MLEGVADGDCARRAVSLDHAGVKDIEAGDDECGARIVEDELGGAVAEIRRHVRTQV